MDTPATWLDVAIATTFPLTLIAIIWTRISTKKGLGVRVIQFMAVAMIVPAVVLLALHNRLQGEAVAAIFGGLAGYLLSSIAKFDERDRD